MALVRRLSHHPGTTHTACAFYRMASADFSPTLGPLAAPIREPADLSVGVGPTFKAAFERACFRRSVCSLLISSSPHCLREWYELGMSDS